MRLQIASSFEDASPDSLKLELFCDSEGVARGWYIGPLILTDGELTLPFAPREQNLPAETAVARAVEIALAADLPIAVIDQDCFWSVLWAAPQPPHGGSSPSLG